MEPGEGTEGRTTGDTQAQLPEQGQKLRSGDNWPDLGSVSKVERDLWSWVPGAVQMLHVEAPGEDKAGSQLPALALGLVCRGPAASPAGRCWRHLHPGSQLGWDGRSCEDRRRQHSTVCSASESHGRQPSARKHPRWPRLRAAITCSFLCEDTGAGGVSGALTPPDQRAPLPCPVGNAP